MLKSVSTMVPVVDLERAVAFYTDVLELKKVDAGGGMVAVTCPDGTAIVPYQRAKTKADHNAAVFQVADIESAVKTLSGRGVEFEELDLPDQGIKTEGGIATIGDSKAAWFKDTEGNIFMIGQM